MLTERKHHERVRTAAIFLMGVVVAMLGIGAGLMYAVVLSLKDTEVRGVLQRSALQVAELDTASLQGWGLSRSRPNRSALLPLPCTPGSRPSR